MFTKSIDSILADFNTKVAQLTKLAEKYQSDAADANRKAEDLRAEAELLNSESARARSIAQKISKLVA